MRKLVFTTIVFVLASAAQVMAQGNIGLQLMIPPGNNFSVDESLRAVITNNSGEPVEIYLRGVVRESEDGVIFEGFSSIFAIEENIVQLNKRNLEPLKPIETNFTNNEYEQYIKRTSEFPPGSYEVCVQILTASDDQVLAEECYEKTVREYLPPSLISPEDHTVVSKSQPYFTWSPVPGADGSDITYKLGIVEIMANQSPIAAFESNPVWFEESGITSPLLQYPMAAREFEKKQAYAWKVTAYAGDNKIAESEVWRFDYKADTSSTGEEGEDEGEEQEDEEALIPEQYVSLSPEYHSGFYLLGDYKLRFVYKNQYASSHVRCNLLNMSNELVAEDMLKGRQSSGLNFNTLDITNRVQPGRPYILRCTGPLGETKGLKFKVRKENSENIIDDLNIDEDLIDFQDGILNGGG